MPGRTRKTSRQFEKDKAAFFNQCKAQHAVCWLCGMPIDYEATKNTTDDSFNLDHMFPVSKHPELQFDPAGFKPQPLERQPRSASANRNTLKTMDNNSMSPTRGVWAVKS